MREDKKTVKKTFAESYDIILQRSKEFMNGNEQKPHKFHEGCRFDVEKTNKNLI